MTFEYNQTVDEIESLESALTSLYGALDSLESQVTYIEDVRSRGVYVDQAVIDVFNNAIVTSMESRDIPEDVYKLALISLESSNDKSEGFIARIWAMIKAVIKRVRELFNKLYAIFNDRLGKVRNKLGELSKHLEVKADATGVKVSGKINLKRWGNLVINSRIDQDGAMHGAITIAKEAIVTATKILEHSDRATKDFRAAYETGDVSKYMNSGFKDYETTIFDLKKGFLSKMSTTKLPDRYDIKSVLGVTKVDFSFSIERNPDHDVPDQEVDGDRLSDIQRLVKRAQESVDEIERAMTPYRALLERMDRLSDLNDKSGGTNKAMIESIRGFSKSLNGDINHAADVFKTGLEWYYFIVNLIHRMNSSNMFSPKSTE